MITITKKDQHGRFVDNTGAPIAKTGNVLFHEDETGLIIFFSQKEHAEFLETLETTRASDANG